MNTNDINSFELASRRKLRFDSIKGALSVEDLWDLPLTSNTGKVNLDDIARDLHKQVREVTDSVSFVSPPPTTRNQNLSLAFDLVKHIIGVRVQERDEANAAQARAAKKQQLLEVLSRKENAALEGKSIEELQAMVNAL